jgi:hypothetical protein
MKAKYILTAIALYCSATLAQADDLTAVVTNTSGSGSIGAVDLSVAGGVAPYVYSWSGPSGFTATTEDISGLAYGTYTITVTDAYCGVAVLTVLVDSAASIGIIEPISLDNSIGLFPNPAQSLLQITSSVDLKQAQVRLIDLNGKSVLVESNKNGKQFQLDVSSLTKGVYLIEISQEGMLSRKKFIKQ